MVTEVPNSLCERCWFAPVELVKAIVVGNYVIGHTRAVKVIVEFEKGAVEVDGGVIKVDSDDGFFCSIAYLRTGLALVCAN